MYCSGLAKSFVPTLMIAYVIVAETTQSTMR